MCLFSPFPHVTRTLTSYPVFRREPLWQVSMNVKVNSAVRCTYEPEENAIRLVLKEPVEGQLGKEPQLEVVVYALNVCSLSPK